jgi:hypothetical protein
MDVGAPHLPPRRAMPPVGETGTVLSMRGFKLHVPMTPLAEPAPRPKSAPSPAPAPRPTTLYERVAALVNHVGGVERAAAIMGVESHAVMVWRSGTYNPPLVEMARLCAAADASLEWLATGQGLRALVRRAALEAAITAYLNTLNAPSKEPRP